MANDAKGVGHFTAENIAAVLRALPETDGTYQQVIEQTQEYGSDVSKATLGKWVSIGRADMRAGSRQTAYPRFAQQFDQSNAEQCNADANRNREFDRAMETLNQTCDSGNLMMLMPDGIVGRLFTGMPKLGKRNATRKKGGESTGDAAQGNRADNQQEE